MFEDDFKFRELLTNRLHDLLNKASLAIENINGGIGHFTVNQQWHADFLHLLEQRVNGFHIADAVAGIGSGIGRVKLGGGEHALLKPVDQFGCIQ
ncbi:hypothetical protein D3C78_1316080 [compost metagenome]